MKIDIKSLVTASILVVIAVLVQIFGYYFLTISLIAAFLTAAIFVVIYLKCDLKNTILSIFVSTLLVFFLLWNVFYAVFYTFFIAMTGAALGIVIKKKKSFSILFIVSAAGFFVSFIGAIVFTNILTGTNIMNQYFDQILPQMMDQFTNMTAISSISVTTDEFKVVLNMVYLLIPSLLIVISAIMGYITICICSLIIKKINDLNEYWFNASFSLIKADIVSVMIYIICFVALMIVKNEAMKVVVMNVYVILLMYLSICGISIFDYWLKNRYSIITPIRILIIGVLFMVLIATQLLPLLAMVDSRLDFRMLDAKGGNHEE